MMKPYFKEKKTLNLTKKRDPLSMFDCSKFEKYFIETDNLMKSSKNIKKRKL